jgi:exo beta-1,2-glucooligosaccharide sophorohydrolase (non-reducing end)
MRLLIIYLLLLSTISFSQEREYDFIIFSNSRMPGNYFFSRVSKVGYTSITNKKEKLPISETVFFTPGNSLKFEYRNGHNGAWNAAVFRPYIRGQDHFKKWDALSFHIYVASGQTIRSGLPNVKLITKDSLVSEMLPCDHGKASNWKPGKWEHVVIPVHLFKMDPERLSEVIGVIFSQGGSDNLDHVIYIDDIEFVSTNAVNVPEISQPAIRSYKSYAMHTDLEWEPAPPGVKYVKIYRSENDINYKPVGIQPVHTNRYADFAGKREQKYYYKISFIDLNYKESALSTPVITKTSTMTDDELLTMVQEATFRYFWDAAEKNSGLAKENTPGRENMIATGASGWGVMSLLVGAERKFITRQQLIERFEKITGFLEKAETFHGAYAHFIDGPTGKVEPFFGSRDNGGDLVETSFLIQGLLAARQYFNDDAPREKAIRDKITRIWEKVEWDWYKQYPDSKFLYWHWSPDQAWVINHTLVGWNETMVTYLLAIASPTHAVPASMYYSGWANQDSTGIKYRSGWGGTMEGSNYTNGNTYYGIKLDVGVSNGGPLFFTHFSYMGYDPRMLTDRYTNYYKNNKDISLINYRYCVANPRKYIGYGDSCWGLSASEGPYDYFPDEPIASRDHGKITPTAAISSFPYTPTESMKALKKFYYSYGKFLWGEYGFRDAFNLTDNWSSDIYMGLSQGTTVVMLENYRSGLVWKLFMSNKDVQDGLKKLEALK